jgi:hypothetical protein
MTIAIGASTITSASFPSSTTTTTGITTAATGSGFYVVVSTHGGSASTVTLADNNSNTYTHISQTFDTSQNYVDRFYVANGAGGSGMTWTATLSPNNSSGIAIIAMEITGAATSSIHDASSPAAVTGAQTTPVSSNSFSATPPSGGELLVSVLTTDIYNSTISFNLPSGYTLVQSQTNSTTNIPATAVAYQVISSSGTEQATGWNYGSTNYNVIVTLDGFLGTSSAPIDYFVQSTSYIGTSPTSSVTCSSAITPLPGDTLITLARVSTPSQIGNVSVSDGHNTYTAFATFNDGTSNAVGVYIASNVSATAVTPVATLSSGSSLTAIMVLDYEGIYGLLGYHGAFQTGTNGTANQLNSGSIAITTTSALLIGACVNLNFAGYVATVGTSPNSFISRATAWNAPGNPNLLIEDATISTGAAVTATPASNNYFLTLGLAFSLQPSAPLQPFTRTLFFSTDTYLQ